MTTKLTRKQRADVYLKAAELIDSGVECYCCWAMGSALGLHRCAYKSDVPEFYLFKPDESMAVWWPDIFHKSQSERVLALLFSHAIALNP